MIRPRRRAPIGQPLPHAFRSLIRLVLLLGVACSTMLVICCPAVVSAAPAAVRIGREGVGDDLPGLEPFFDRTVSAQLAAHHIPGATVAVVGDGRILEETTAREMHSQHFANDPRLPGMAYGFYEQAMNGLRLLAHGGVTLWFQALVALIPHRGVGLFVVYDSPEGESAKAELLQAFLDRYYPASAESAPAPHTLPGFAARAAQISGTYWPTRHSYSTYWKLLMLLAPTTVSVTGPGHLAITDEGVTADLVEVAPWVFRQVGRQDTGTVVFRPSSGGMGVTMLAGNKPSEDFVRVP